MRARRPLILNAFITAALCITVAAPALAAPGEAKAAGAITWDGEGGNDPGRASAFSVFDGVPGAIGSDSGDRGWYALDKQNGASMLMDISCVRIVAEEGWAEFAGTIVEAQAPFTVGEVFQVAVVDSGRGGKHGDQIGMKHRADIAQGCELALDDVRLGRKGIITGGNIRLRGPR